MLDLIVTCGTCVLPSGTMLADIGVKAQRIAVVGAPGTLGEAERKVDATGKLVIPGGIDPHIHCSMPVRAPGRPVPHLRDQRVVVDRPRDRLPHLDVAERRPRVVEREDLLRVPGAERRAEA